MNTFKNFRISRWAKLAGVIILFTLFNNTVSAETSLLPQATTSQELIRLTAIPARLGEDFSLRAKPGESLQTMLSVKNTSTQAQTIRTSVEDFIVGEDGKDPAPVVGASSQWSLAQWITLTPSINNLLPNQLATITVSIDIPKDALPGGHYAMVMHEPSISTSNSSGTSISQRVGTLVYVMVEGTIHEEAYINNLKAKQLFEYGPVPFSFTIENRSDIHIRPNIQVEITNIFSQKVDTFTVDTQNIFPSSSREFKADWNRKWGLGRYTAHILASYGNEAKIIQYNFTFWIIPIRVLLLIFFILALISILLLVLKRKIKNNEEEKKLLKQKVKAVNTQHLERFKDDAN